MDARRKFALVAVPAPLREPLTYAVPEALGSRIEVGMRVLVPLGRRRVTGVVTGFQARSPVAGTREVAECLDHEALLDEAFLKLCRWAADYYVAPLGEVLAAALPPLLRTESRVVAAFARYPEEIHGEIDREVLDALRRGPMTPAALSRRFPRRGVKAALDRLAGAGAVTLEDRLRGHVREARRRKQPLPEEVPGAAPASRAPALTREQRRALGSMDERLGEGGFETVLLHGVTGSGKTEVYLQAMERVRRRGRQCLILVPEIALTPQLLDRLEARFPGDVAVLHSGLASAERWRQWWRIVHGGVNVVAGARSAVFAPVRNLGLIVVDEEHDHGYKQEEGVRYHARDLAVVRGRIVGCPVILGSATPSVESYHNARSGRYRLAELTGRVESRPMPEVEVVDLKTGPARPAARDGIFSAPLLQALQENHALGRQSLVFLNRRGFASFLQCQACGFVVRCPHCSISLTYHLGRDSTFCHHCGFRRRKADACPGCGNLSLGEVGFGTERVEHELRRLLPKARIGRMDRDTTGPRGAQERIFRSWEKGDLDILVGTQMIAKGHDVGGVTLVGVVLADSSLNLPDFRAAEKTFQIISQVAGRAGRARGPGRVIVQTLAPGHYCFDHARVHDYRGFFATETEFRRELGYPPFRHLVHLRLDGAHEGRVARGARELVRGLRRDSAGAAVEILGPAPAPISRLRNRYRWQILLKGRSRPTLLAMARRAVALMPGGKAVRIHVDVDPYHML